MKNNLQSVNRAELVQRRQLLSDRIDAIHADVRRGLPADSQERATELENADVLAEIERITVAQLAEVDKQLAQLDTAE